MLSLDNFVSAIMWNSLNKASEATWRKETLNDGRWHLVFDERRTSHVEQRVRRSSRAPTTEDARPCKQAGATARDGKGMVEQKRKDATINRRSQ